MRAPVELEIAVDGSFASELEQLGIRRMELCAQLECGGLTPDLAAVREARAAFSGHLSVLVRRTPDSFEATGAELRTLLDDVAAVIDAGADAVVAGVLLSDRSIDQPALEKLRLRAATAQLVFHRAFDLVADPEAAFRLLHQNRVDGLLTSGCAPTALAGAAVLRRLGVMALESGAPALIAGGGIRDDHAAQVAAIAGVAVIHRSGLTRGKLDHAGILRTQRTLKTSV